VIESLRRTLASWIVSLVGAVVLIAILRAIGVFK
jgi:uncharacterized membrane protein YeaQ/YmgE (transglycosylase-associated protein family)